MSGHPLGGGEHALAGVGIAAEGVEHPVLARGRSAGGTGGRVDEVGAVARPVGHDDEPHAVAARGGGVDARDGGRARLHDQWTGDRTQPEPRRERRRAVERLPLRDREPEHQFVDLPTAAALAQRPLGDLCGDVEAGQLGRRALPAHERR